jgi:diketogulonate reductase-like aldo/keto reductase
MVQLHWEPPQQQQAAGSNRIQGFVAAAKALQQLQQRGLVGAVGVSNFDQRMLMALLDAGVKPVSNQVRSRQIIHLGQKSHIADVSHECSMCVLFIYTSCSCL